MEPSTAQTYETVTNADVRCTSCGYSLIGLPTAGACPECGVSVIDSTVGMLLQYSSHEHLKKLHTGAVFIVAGSVAQLLVGLLSASVEIALLGMTAVLLPEVAVSITLLQFLVAAPLLYGWWLFSAPDDTYEGKAKEETPRRLLRITVVTQTVTVLPAYLASVFAMFATNLTAVIDETDSIAVLLVILALSLFAVLAILAYLVAFVTQFFASMLYTGALGRRIPNVKVIKRARTLMWLGPVLLTFGLLILVGPFIAIVLYCSMFNWIRKDLKRIRAAKLKAEIAGLAPATLRV